MAILSVGSSDPPDCLSAAIAAAEPHDQIHVCGDLEISDSIICDKPLHLIGRGVRPTITARGQLRRGKGILVPRASMLVCNLAFRGASALTGNGAGIWQEQGDLVLEDCEFSDNQNGVMAAAGPSDSFRAYGCRFTGNGGGCGHTHSLYVSGALKSAVVMNSSFERTHVGHHVKSRAAETRIENCYFGADYFGTTSCEIDVPNGGDVLVKCNQFIKGRGAMSRKFISFCAERPLHEQRRLVVESNIFISHVRLSVAVCNHALSASAMLRNNAFEGVLLALLGRGREIQRRSASVAIAEGV